MNKRAGMCCLVLAAAPNPASLPAIAKSLELSETMAGNVLRALVLEGVLSRDGLDISPRHVDRTRVIAQSEAEFYRDTVLRPAQAAGRPAEPATLDHPGRPIAHAAGSPVDPKAGLVVSDPLPGTRLPVPQASPTAPATDRTDSLAAHHPHAPHTAQEPAARTRRAPRFAKVPASAYPPPGPVQSDVPLPVHKRRAQLDHWGFADLAIGDCRMVTPTPDGLDVHDLQQKITNAGRTYAYRNPGFALSVRILPDGRVGYWRVDPSTRRPYGPRAPKTPGNGAHP